MCNGLYNNTINASYFSTERNTIALVQFIVNRVRVASMLTASREIGFSFFFFYDATKAKRQSIKRAYSVRRNCDVTPVNRPDLYGPLLRAIIVWYRYDRFFAEYITSACTNEEYVIIRWRSRERFTTNRIIYYFNVSFGRLTKRLIIRYCFSLRFFKKKKLCFLRTNPKH